MVLEQGDFGGRFFARKAKAASSGLNHGLSATDPSGAKKDPKNSHILALFGEALDTPTRDQPDNHHYHNDHQNNMNQASTDMERESKKPQDQQNKRNSPKHNPEFTIRNAMRSSHFIPPSSYWRMTGRKARFRVPVTPNIDDITALLGARFCDIQN